MTFKFDKESELFYLKQLGKVISNKEEQRKQTYYIYNSFSKNFDILPKIEKAKHPWTPGYRKNVYSNSSRAIAR